MKTLLVVVGITAGFVASLSAQVGTGTGRRRSDAGPYQTGGTASHSPIVKRKVVASTPRQEACVYYYTNYTATGSQIPMVVRRYKGVSRPLGAGRGNDVYTGSDVGATGVLDLGPNLKRLDPDIF